VKLLFVGDVIGRPGRTALRNLLPRLVARHRADYVVVNVENSAGGFGVTPEVMAEIADLPIDCYTTGNHVWDKKEGVDLLDREPRLLRPANYPAGNPGTGVYVGETAAGVPVATLNLEGRVFRVSAVVGTHTHVPTADERILPGGTALLTDVGMTGPYESIIGMRADKVVRRFLLQTRAPFEVAKRDVRLAAVVVEIDEATGHAQGIERLLIPDPSAG
jgi:calcineurin-like phosphoesterase